MKHELDQICAELKKDLIAYHAERKLGHLGSCLSCLEIMTSLFWKALTPTDHFILSKGHAASLLYIILHKKSLLSKAQLDSSLKDGSPLGGHPPFQNEFSHPWWGFGSGSLGYGIGLGSGVSLGLRLNSKADRVFVLVSDGDLNEGSSWESLNFAAQQKLGQLWVCYDSNKVQALGESASIFPLSFLADALHKMGWDVQTLDGHDLHQIKFESPFQDKPHFLIFNTSKNKGIETQLNPVESHYQWITSMESRS